MYGGGEEDALVEVRRVLAGGRGREIDSIVRSRVYAAICC